MKYLVVANWKMNPATWRDAKKLFEATKKAADHAKNITVVVAPPALYLRELRSRYKGKRVAFAIQHAHFEPKGPFTGEISLAQAKDTGVSYAIIGHAERRALGESNDDTRKKIATALAANITSILCVGENKRSSDGTYFTVIKEQLRIGLADVVPSQLKRIIITYEPLWTIGGNTTMSPRDMHEMVIFIRKTIVELCGEKGMKVKILYGGSVDETNAEAMLHNGDVHGLLVGRASEDAEKFSALMNSIAYA